MNPKTIIISRTDSIGDVMLTLPMCGILKEKFPGVRIVFLARAYTQALIAACEHIDQFINWDEIKEGSPAAQIQVLKDTGADTIIHVFPRKEILWLAKRAHIPVRIATGHRIYTIGKCNKLVFFSRKKSDLHEAQLNLKLLRPLGIEVNYPLTTLAHYAGFSKVNSEAQRKTGDFLKGFDRRRRVILHPLSKGSASEWSLENYQKLCESMPDDGFVIFITGTKEEGEKIRGYFPIHGENVHDVTGRFSLEELIEFIRQCDVLVAASTGPLHIAAVAGIGAVGLYSPRRPTHPGRWAPIGEKAIYITAEKHPIKGEKLAISPAAVLKGLLSFLK